MSLRNCLLTVLMVSLSHSGAAQARPVLELSEVLRSSLKSHPKVAVADAKVQAAEANRLGASGAFDLKLYANGHYAPLGKYDRPRGELGLKQPTTVLGAQLWAKYENGSNFAPYDGKRVTSEAGKASLGVLLPLMQGRSTDARRFARHRARLELQVAQELRRNQRASLLADAASTWWMWVISGKKLAVYKKLLEQAEHRQSCLKEQEALGAIGRIQTVDNERLVAERRAQLVGETWKFRKLSLKLSLYRRAKNGTPLSVELSSLPEAVAPVEVPVSVLKQTLANLKKAPAPQVYGETLRILKAELELARNDQLPQLDLEVYGAQSFGEERPYSLNDSSLTETVVGGMLKFSMPVQRRKARGKAALLRAKKRQLELERRFALEQLSARARMEFAALVAQYESAKLSRQAVRYAREVAEAEADSFALGDSSVLSVNLREQATLKSYLGELDSVLGYHLSWIELQRISGRESIVQYLPPRGVEENE